jgi:hypothetical protein
MASLVNQMVGALREQPVRCAVRCAYVAGALLALVVLVALVDFLPAPYH